MAIQLSNHPISQDIFKLIKLLSCIIITEPRRKILPNAQISRDMVTYINLVNFNPAALNTMVHIIILIDDLNSKHQTWGCLKTNQNGNKLLKIISEQRIIISPPPSPTFQRPIRQPDILDIALIYNLPINLHHQVLNELDSDHVPVILTMNNQIKINHPIPKLINAPIKWKPSEKI